MFCLCFVYKTIAVALFNDVYVSQHGPRQIIWLLQTHTMRKPMLWYRFFAMRQNNIEPMCVLNMFSAMHHNVIKHVVFCASFAKHCQNRMARSLMARPPMARPPLARPPMARVPMAQPHTYGLDTYGLEGT